jgi:hypothetical protein
MLLNIKKKLLLDLEQPFYIYGFILFIISFLSTGYAVYEINQAFQIPLVHLLNNPSLYPNDPLAATLPDYPSLLWRVVAFVARIIPLEPLLFILFLLERILVIYAAGNLARLITGGSKLAIIGAIAIFALAISPILGGGTLVENYFEQTGLSIPFFLLAIASFYNARPLPCAIWTAIGFNLNSMYGTYALTYFGAVFLLDSSYRQVWKKWLMAFGLFLVLATPVVFPTLSALERNAPDNHLWLVASKLRFSHHLYPLTWKGQQFAKFAVLLFSLVALLYQNRYKREKLYKHGVIWTGVSLLWLLYAFVAAYIFKSPSMLVMHPARGTDLWYCFAGIALVSICALKLEASKGKQKRTLWAFGYSASILFWYSDDNVYVRTAFVIALILLFVWDYILSQESFSRLALLLTLCVLVAGIRSFDARLVRTQSVATALIKGPSFPVEQIASWANVNTSMNAVFLISPIDSSWKSFRGLAKRPVFIAWKDASAILWDRTFVQVWAERLKALGFDITEGELNDQQAIDKLNHLYQQLRDEDVKRLKSRFPISYWVVPVEHPSKLAIAFQSQFYKVLDLK